jgi:hypothetical protein
MIETGTRRNARVRKDFKMKDNEEKRDVWRRFGHQSV